MKITVSFFVLIAAFIVSSCHSLTSGNGSLAFNDRVEPPGADQGARSSEDHSESQSRQVVEAHAVGPLASPFYPESVLKSGIGHLVVPTQVVVGTDGRVTKVALRTGTFAFSIPHYEEFMAEIHRCVDQWRFSPARVIVSRMNEMSLVETVSDEAVEMSFDVDFSFDENVRLKEAPKLKRK
jgi:hypothetical protein